MTWLSHGHQVFPAEAATQAWVDAVCDPALEMVADEAARAAWLRHGGTWFAGVDILPNDASGAAFRGPALAGAALDAAQSIFGGSALHQAQVSVTYPGYPRRDPGETEAAHRFRRNRDAAHLDGLLPVGPERRRYLREPHAYILGLALTDADPGAAPLVVYEGSHEVLRAAFSTLFDGRAPEEWGEMDATDTYTATRRHVFETCPRVELPLKRGQVVLLHRLLLHGIAPWAEGAEADPRGRAIAYFRPECARVADWLTKP